MIKSDYNNSDSFLSIFDDKKFVIKLTLLILSIVILSFVGITQNKDIEFLEAIKSSSIKFESLKSIEEKLGGKNVDVTISQNELETLSELDLSDVELHRNDTKPVSGMEKIDTKSDQNRDKHHNIYISDGSSNQKISHKKNIIITSEVIKPVGSIKKRFYKTNDISYALLISKKFFKQKRYQKALKWSLIANEIDNANEDSWIMFAKSKIKLGKKEDAVGALSAYLKEHHSAKVKALLDDIENNS